MKKFNVTGMSCAACSAAVTRAVQKVDGVERCDVSLLTNSMTVDGSFSDAAVIAAVKGAGYGASLPNEKAAAEPVSETRGMVKRLITSAVFLLALMYVSMGRMMFGFPLPAPLADSMHAQALLQLLLCVAVMVINQKFFISGSKSLIKLHPNMDALIAIGSGAAFAYSVWNTFVMLTGGGERHLYFETAAMILTLITVGKTLESYSKGKTTNALRALMELKPQTATVERDGEEKTVPADEVTAGDIFLLRPGDRVPADGVVVEGASAIDESALTGESVPVDKAAGDKVSAATVNRSGFLRCRATGVGEDTAISRIIKMVEDASASKAPIARTADRVAGVFVPFVMGAALVTAIIWMIISHDFPTALSRAIAVLVISCPCALGLATPVAIMVGSGVGAKNGILFKNAAAIEAAGRVKTVLLDKTGTVTTGAPAVTDVIPADGVESDTLLRLAASLEQPSEHPFAGAILRAAKGMELYPVDGFEALSGSGLRASVGSHTLTGGSVSFISTLTALPDGLKERANALAEQGKTPLLFMRDDTLLGLIAAADSIKEDSPAAIAKLKAMGVTTVMLTGDNERTANAVGAAAGVDRVVAGVLPDGKEAAVREYAPAAMVGDGINDAPALTRADVGIAIGAGTDVAVEAADVVLIGSTLTDAVNAIRLGRATLMNIRENLFWAFIYNVIGIPLAAGAFGFQLDPMFGALAMSLSSVCVVSNALRLNLFRADKIKKEEKTMEKTLKVKGMMCEHCERRVREALEGVDGVSSATADHKKGIASVTLSKEVSDETLKAAVTAAGYEAK